MLRCCQYSLETVHRRVCLRPWFARMLGMRCQHNAWCMTRTTGQGQALQHPEHLVAGETCLQGLELNCVYRELWQQDKGGTETKGTAAVGGWERRLVPDTGPPKDMLRDTLAVEHLSMQTAARRKSPLWWIQQIQL